MSSFTSKPELKFVVERHQEISAFEELVLEARKYLPIELSRFIAEAFKAAPDLCEGSEDPFYVFTHGNQTEVFWSSGGLWNDPLVMGFHFGVVIPEFGSLLPGAKEPPYLYVFGYSTKATAQARLRKKLDEVLRPVTSALGQKGISVPGIDECGASELVGDVLNLRALADATKMAENLRQRARRFTKAIYPVLQSATPPLTALVRPR